MHEPEIQAVNSPISGQDAIEECNEAEGDDVGELEQVTQLGREKTESFFTRYIDPLIYLFCYMTFKKSFSLYK